MLPSRSWSQGIDTSIPADSTTMGEFLEHLDLSQVPHGLLLDQSFQIADLSLFDGTQDSVYATSGLLRRIYGTLMGAAVSPVSQLPDYNATLGPLFESDTLPLKALLFNYGAFKEHAVDDNLLSISNNQLYDVANRPESPYLSKTLLAASPWCLKSIAPFKKANDVFSLQTGYKSSTRL